MYLVDICGLAHPKYPIDDVPKLVPKQYALGAIDGAFGELIPRLSFLVKRGFRFFRPHAWWSDAHEIVPLDVLRQRAVEYERFAYNSKCKVWLSHSCEHWCDDLDHIKKCIQIIAELAPSCIPVNCFDRKGLFYPGVINENHDPFQILRGKYSKTTDGINSHDIDFGLYKRTHTRAELVGVWGERFNGREDPGGEFVPRPERVAWPSPQYMCSELRLLEPKGKAPPKVPGMISINAPYLYKSHSEDDLGQNLRDNKPVLIVPGNSGPMEIITCNRKVIGELKWGGPFEDGLQRYYSGVPGAINLYGYEIGQKAKKISGSEFVGFRQDKERFGWVNPAFRAGYFRKKE